MRRFQLTEDMGPDNLAEAKMVFYNGTDDTYDPRDRLVRYVYNVIGDYRPRSGDIVYAKRWSDSIRWEIIRSPSDFPCGDLLAGWHCHDGDEKNCAGSATVTLLASDEPEVGGTNNPGLVGGYVDQNAWELIHTSGIFTACKWAQDSPDFMAIDANWTMRFVVTVNNTDGAGGQTVRYFYDHRGAYTVTINTDTDRIELLLWDNTETITLSFDGGDTIVPGTPYAIYVRWDEAERTADLSVTPVDVADRTRLPFESTVLENSIQVQQDNYGIFVGDFSLGTGMGMDGNVEALEFWQRKLRDCECDGDFNCGRMRLLSAANRFAGCDGGIHTRDKWVDSPDQPTPSPGDQVLWKDTTNKRYFIVANHPTDGVKLTDMT
jgi:hypothetical protein